MTIWTFQWLRASRFHHLSTQAGHLNFSISSFKSWRSQPCGCLPKQNGLHQVSLMIQTWFKHFAFLPNQEVETHSSKIMESFNPIIFLRCRVKRFAKPLISSSAFLGSFQPRPLVAQFGPLDTGWLKKTPCELEDVFKIWKLTQSYPRISNS